MGFRFRQRIKIAPGIYLNLGKKGVNSVSMRAGPFTSNINKDGIKHTAGLHGSGLSYETQRSSWSGGPNAGMSSTTKRVLWFIAIVFLFIYLVH